MRKIRRFGPEFRILSLAGLCAALAAESLHGQEPAMLSLDEARALARLASPELVAARAAVAAAAARELQAGAFRNPTISYQREQTSGGGRTNSQNIASIDQPIELGGARGARIDVARLRHEVAEARLAAVEAQVEYEVTRAYALAAAADRRVTLVGDAANAFGRARTVSQARLAQGDVSGYAHRRIQLEAARYAALLAGAQLERRTARIALLSLLASSPDSASALRDVELALDESLPAASQALSDDTLRALAGRHRAELRAATLEAEVASAEAMIARRERTPVPTITAGFKSEQVVAGDDFNGFVAGLSLPIPLWDRRRGAIEAASAESRRRVAEAEVVRRRIAREVLEAAEALRAVEQQLALLRPQLGAESQAALRSAQAAYGEGEISLVEWLDAVRAYQEAEATFASLRGESLIRLAALERAVGVPLSRDAR